MQCVMDEMSVPDMAGRTGPNDVCERNECILRERQSECRDEHG